jgi:hypothetical protein
MKAMADRAPSAAEALFGHLPKGTPDVVQQGRRGSVADAMYPRPKPPLKNPYLEPMTETEWHDQLWALAGLRRKR